jgi:hypothetical protein
MMSHEQVEALKKGPGNKRPMTLADNRPKEISKKRFVIDGP